MRRRRFVARVVLQGSPDTMQFVAQLLELTAQVRKQPVVRRDRRIERLDGAVHEREAHFEFGQPLLEQITHYRTYNRPSTAAAGRTYLTS